MSQRVEIEKIYIAYFNRPADYAGLSYWDDRLSDGGTFEEITRLFSTTAEYRSIYGGANSREIVTAVYKNLFGRAPEAEGLEYWTNALDKGEQSVGTLAYAALMSAQNSDKTIIDNKASVAFSFSVYVNHAKANDQYADGAMPKVRAWLSNVDETDASVTQARADLVALVKSFAGNSGSSLGSSDDMLFDATQLGLTNTSDDLAAEFRPEAPTADLPLTYSGYSGLADLQLVGLGAAASAQSTGSDDFSV